MVSAYAAAAAVVDPEIRVLTIEDLGILREVRVDGAGRVTVRITPTYSGCPAMDLIRAEIVRSLAEAGYPAAEVRTELAPAWSTDLISAAGRRKLAAAGIAPPGPAGPVPVTLLARRPGTDTEPVDCPRCGSADTERLSAFGSTACKALCRCRTCLEPFEQVKPL